MTPDLYARAERLAMDAADDPLDMMRIDIALVARIASAGIALRKAEQPAIEARIHLEGASRWGSLEQKESAYAANVRAEDELLAARAEFDRACEVSP
jgi:hypothetical protein